MKSNLQYYLDFDQASKFHYDTVLDKEPIEEAFNMTADQNAKPQFISIESAPWKPAQPPKHHLCERAGVYLGTFEHPHTRGDGPGSSVVLHLLDPLGGRECKQ